MAPHSFPRSTDGVATLLYDGRCRLCAAWAARLERLAKGRVQAEPLQTAATRFRLSETEALREIKLVTTDGRIYGGAEAIVKLVALGRPVLGKLLYLYYLPGLRWLAERVYGWVAQNRYRLFGRAPDTCDTGSCALHDGMAGKRPNP